MAGRRGTSLVLMLTCLAASTAGVDNDVQKVDLPEVVKDPLGPRMEVLSQSGPREMRAATFPGFPSGCLSCTTGGLGGSTYGSSYSLDAGFPRPGLLRPVSESQGNSYKHEVRSESKIVNGQPVYDLYHERRFEDGNLVHEERKEKGAKDVDASLSLGQAQGYPDGPGYSRHLHETHLQSSSVGSSDYGSAGTLSAHGGVSPDYNSDLSSLSERLRQQMLLLKNRKGHENLGGSHHAVYSQTRYVNGQPVYVKKEERKYEDGQLVYNRTDEKGPDDLGTQHVAQQYDTSGSPVGPGGGYYERREEQRHFSSSSQGSHALHPGTFPGRAPAREESLYHRQDSAYPSYRPGYNSGSTGSSTQYTHESREETSSGYRPTSGSSTQYTQESREETSSGYRPYRPTSGGSSTQYTQDSREETSSGYRPYRPTSGGSSTQYTQDSREETSSGYRPYRPTSGGSSTQYTQDSREETSSGYRPYRPTSGGSSTQYTQDSREETSSGYRPTSGSSSTQYTQESREETSSGYRPYRPTSGSSSTQYTQESREETSSGYRPYRPTSGSSSTQYTQETREESSSGYRPYRPTSGSSTQYTQDTREESSPRHTPDRATSSSSSTQYTLESQSSHRPQTDRWTHTQQTDEELHSSYRPASRPSTSSTHSRQDTSTSTQYTQESTEGPTYPSRPSYRPSGSTSHEREESYESSWQQQRRNHTYTPSSGDFHTTVVQQNTRQPETTTQGALDSSRRDGSSDIYSQTYEQSSSTDSTNHDQYSRGYNTEYDQRQQGVTSHYSQEASAERRLTTDEGRDTVGIPGVLSGPHSQYGNDEKHNKERYDISPLEDNGPELPSVDNEIDSSYVPTLAPVDSEIDSSVYSGRGQESAIHTDRRYHSSRQDTSRTDTHSQGRPTHGYSDSSYHYRHNRTTTQGAINSVPVSTPAQVPGADDASSYGYPSVEGTSRHHYNESWRTSISADSQPQPAYGSTSSSSSSSQVRNCGQFSCIVVGDGQLSSSRQTQTRVSTRYVNGELVGITHHIRQYEDGKLVHENRTEQSVDDLSEEDLRRYGIDQLHLVQGSYQPESYSQRHEVRQEKKYVNGEQTYDLHHERRFEDGSLVYENRTEKDADELGASSPGGYEGSYSQTHQEGGARHEVTQSQHLQQHVTSGAVGDITAGHAAETQQVTDTAHVAVVPVYTSRRYETRRQQEFVDGQPTYDLHHERHFNNGSLVYENKTELNEGELRTSHSSGHQDALHQILSGNTLSTAYDRSSSATAHGSYGSGLEASRSSYGESAASQSAGSYSGSSASYHGSESSRQTGLYGESASSQIGGSYSGSSSQGSGSYGGTGVSYSSSSSSETHESSASGFPVGHTAGSSRATTSVLGAGSYSSSSQQESSGGCLSCMLVGSSGFSGQGSLGVSGGAGADGYSHRQEMNMEEHYEDGQLVHGQEESRVFENGQLVHESQRQYADAPSQSFRASALQSSEASSGEAASCEKSYCQNGGTCIPGFMGPLCTCPFGFKGKDCSEPYCPKRFCRYGGSCRVDGARHVCACAEGYSGYRCQTRTYRHARRHASKP
nr:hornerin-like isoform X11 [Penaeus vannamei]XP_027228622.1 hornerin-like isoform X12 [Penaeus vannamei]